MGGRGASYSRSGGGSGGGVYGKTLPTLEGSEKQVKWGNDIRKQYVEDVNNTKKYLLDVKKEGTFFTKNRTQDVLDFDSHLQSTALEEFKESGSKIYRAYTSAKSSKERKQLRPEYNRELANYHIKVLDRNVNKILKEKKASYFIDNRRKLKFLSGDF